MAVGVENTASASDTSSGGSASGTLSLTVSAANALIVIVCTQSGNSTAPAVTWDSGGSNQAMTLIGHSNQAVYIFGLLAPVTGTKTLAWSWTGATDWTVGAAGLTGVGPITVGAAFVNFTTAANTGVSTASISVPITTVGDLVIGGASDLSPADSGISGTTLAAAFNSPNGGNQVINYTSPAASPGTLSYTLGASLFWQYAAVDVVATPPVPPAPLLMGQAIF